MASPLIANDGSRLRLNTTIKLRWFAVAGQTVTVLFVYYGLQFLLPLRLCLGVISVSVALNAVLAMANPRSHQLPSKHAALLLGYDILQLAALIFLTGGLENPFAVLLVVPVAVSASTQPLRVTVALTAFDIALTTVLVGFHFPLPWAHGAPPVLPHFYMVGLWAALVLCIAFIAFYAWRIGQETRQMSQALTAAELILAREQRLSALDGLAAAAAHQLGTPLSTITLVAKELEREVPHNSPLREDIVLLQSQAARCRDILSELSKSGPGREDDYFAQIPLSHLIEEVVAPLRTPGVEIKVRITDAAPSSKPSGEPVIPRNPGLIHALVNLVENATEFAKSTVTIDASYDQNRLRLRIGDDGPGFSAHIINYLGEPYVTSRPRGYVGNDEAGMGLGFFIAKTFLERSGGVVAAENRTPPASGAMVQIVWPRAKIEFPG
jgi:two-component system, sensor histidine kinase RegB